MQIVEKILNTEEVNYTSNLNAESLKKKVEDLLEKRNSHVDGKLTSENEFTLYDKWIVVGWNMPNLKRKAAYLYGKITKDEKGTLVNLKVNPNSILPLFGIFSIVVGLIISLISISNSLENRFFFILGIVFLTMGIIYYPVSTFLRNRLRNKIVKHLDLIKA